MHKTYLKQAEIENENFNLQYNYYSIQLHLYVPVRSSSFVAYITEGKLFRKLVKLIQCSLKQYFQQTINL